MSIELRRRYKKRAKQGGDKKDKKSKKRRFQPTQEETPEDVEARKKSQRISMFDRKKKQYKKYATS